MNKEELLKVFRSRLLKLEEVDDNFSCRMNGFILLISPFPAEPEPSSWAQAIKRYYKEFPQEEEFDSISSEYLYEELYNLLKEHLEVIRLSESDFVRVLEEFMEGML
jgi:hypothetical protein